jgi:dihydropteroate synthase
MQLLLYNSVLVTYHSLLFACPSMLPSLRIQNHTLTWGARTYVMGILNVTPDSFSGDGLLSQADALAASLAQARQFVEAGADILDVGGESTRPGSEPLSAVNELARVLPVIEVLSSQFPNTLISIDTYKATVAEAALRAGAQIVNDVWGLRADPDLAAVVKKFEAPAILMHNRSNPASVEVRAQLGNAYVGHEYANLLEDVKRELLESVNLALAAGIAKEKIILDPGIGFGKTVAQNLALIDRLGEIRELGFPVLLGPSRKSFIGYNLDLPPDQRLEGTAATISVGITRGADLIRVHDVKEMVRIAKMTDALVRRGSV